jgi:hypothetical protein
LIKILGILPDFTDFNKWAVRWSPSPSLEPVAWSG